MATLRGIDVGGSANLNFNMTADIAKQVGFCIVKATEGATFKWESFQRIVNQCDSLGVPFGFYHYAKKNDAIKEADAFYETVSPYIGKGIPCLDWEKGQSVEWVNKFLARFYELAHVYPWVYGNAWRFEQGKVNGECDRWVARYPVVITDLNADLSKWTNQVDGLLACWQFSESIKLSGYSGTVDGNIFYGSKDQWRLYAEGDRTVVEQPALITVEDENYRVDITRK